jgi:hypothetical protein
MALSDNENEKQRKRTKNRAIDAGSNFRWSDKQKLEALHSYLALGNLALTSRILGIPEITLRVWKASEWWKQATEEIKVQEHIELSNRMKKLVEASQLLVAQRLEQGDPVLNQKTGQIVMKPVSLKDAHKVAVDLIDRRKDIEKMAQGKEENTEQDDKNKLEQLAEKFAEMATKSIEKNFNKRRTVDAEDIEVIDAVHEEREEGLQTGERSLQLPSGANQEEVGTDDSPPTS